MRRALLGAYLHPGEREPGETPAEQRRNIRRRIQTLDTDQLLLSAAGAPVRSLRQIQQALPKDAVLVALVIGEAGPDAARGYHGVIITSDAFSVRAMYDPTKPGRMLGALVIPGDDLGIGQTVFSDFGRGVESLRRALTDDPLHRTVTRTASAELRDMAGYLHEPFLRMLDEIAGPERSRLILWPHESAYFLPLHLVPFGGGIFADRFAISVIPSLECLLRPTSGSPSGDMLAVASAAGGVPVGLMEEPSLHEQARHIAALFGTTALVGADATPVAVRERLGGQRYLHIAAHGRQDADAPVFARVYLEGAPLHAYEILQQDLRGVELVTLSACESALLRYDFHDNLHGLAPAFLRAGAHAVVGALWPVEPDVAHVFFIRLYANLHEGAAPVPAFHEAQRHTRARHSAYRDWGAFMFLGA